MAQLLVLKRNTSLLADLASLSAIERHGFDPERLVNEPNIFLTEDGEGALFEYDRPHVYTGHYFFRQSRGKTALRLGQRILSEMFNVYGAEVIQGLTPVYLKQAKLMNKLLGFKDYGIVDTVAGPMGLYILTKKDFTE